MNLYLSLDTLLILNIISFQTFNKLRSIFLKVKKNETFLQVTNVKYQNYFNQNFIQYLPYYLNFQFSYYRRIDMYRLRTEKSPMT